MTNPDRAPTEDEQAGMAWWNAMTETGRAYWLRKSGSATAADAWAVYKSRPILEQDPQAWRDGVAAGIAGDRRCPYPETSPKAWAWSSGWIEGDAKRLARK